MMKNIEQIRDNFGVRLQENVRLSHRNHDPVWARGARALPSAVPLELAADVHFYGRWTSPVKVLGSGSTCWSATAAWTL
jgi:hypothetical protein